MVLCHRHRTNTFSSFSVLESFHCQKGKGVVGTGRAKTSHLEYAHMLLFTNPRCSFNSFVYCPEPSGPTQIVFFWHPHCGIKNFPQKNNFLHMTYNTFVCRCLSSIILDALQMYSSEWYPCIRLLKNGKCDKNEKGWLHHHSLAEVTLWGPALHLGYYKCKTCTKQQPPLFLPCVSFTKLGKSNIECLVILSLTTGIKLL